MSEMRRKGVTRECGFSFFARLPIPNLPYDGV